MSQEHADLNPADTQATTIPEEQKHRGSLLGRYLLIQVYPSLDNECYRPKRSPPYY
jgi:hypothetical protein